MKNIMIASYDMEVGGVERSLISLLENFNYDQYAVDLMLYRHQGDFINMIPSRVHLLEEVSAYTTFRKSIREIFQEKQYAIGVSRILSKLAAVFQGKIKHIKESGYYQMQLMWRYALPFLPKVEKEYDIAISYLWPHDFIAKKVKARTKIAWIHTDYSTVDTHVEMDLNLWNQFDHIIAVSEACREAFLTKYRSLEHKVKVIENITSPLFVRNMANNEVNDSIASDSRFKLVTVARLSSAKGIDLAIGALKLLQDRGYGDQVVWYVVGYGGDEVMLRELIKSNNLTSSFILLGKKINPYPYIKDCDLFVLPSRYEGKAVTVTEAKILGKPILITNYSTAPSQINDGVDGVICELSEAGIAAGIEKLMKNAELRRDLTNYLEEQDHSNNDEIDKLYRLMGA
ncbi:glycosyltransferase [Paenibacillus sp. 1_12]|uniref:glycosyltransferase n=1 Tax=Paenibacillus sp. 1_12 TaxID=1566278 RepID=UPI000B82025C|nr:glycosyltransferase [Paenibacillus sp. 1_12]